MKKLLTALLLISTLAASAQLTPTDAGSKVGFTIKNLGSRVNGSFSGLAGSINFDPKNLAGCSFNVSVNTATVNTNNGSRDKHLKKSDYFDATKFTTLTITSTKVTTSSTAGRYFLIGNITIKGVTKPIQFSFSAIASGTGYLFDGSFELNRRDFGVGGSSLILSDKLTVNLSVLATK